MRENHREWSIFKMLLVYLAIFSIPTYMILFMPYSFTFEITLLSKGFLFVILIISLFLVAGRMQEASPHSYRVAGLIAASLGTVAVIRTYQALEFIKAEIAAGHPLEGLFGVFPWPWLATTFECFLVLPAITILLVAVGSAISFLPTPPPPSYLSEEGAPIPPSGPQ